MLLSCLTQEPLLFCSFLLWLRHRQKMFSHNAKEGWIFCCDCIIYVRKSSAKPGLFPSYTHAINLGGQVKPDLVCAASGLEAPVEVTPWTAGDSVLSHMPWANFSVLLEPAQRPSCSLDLLLLKEHKGYGLLGAKSASQNHYRHQDGRWSDASASHRVANVQVPMAVEQHACLQNRGGNALLMPLKTWS